LYYLSDATLYVLEHAVWYSKVKGSMFRHFNAIIRPRNVHGTFLLYRSSSFISAMKHETKQLTAPIRTGALRAQKVAVGKANACCTTPAADSQQREVRMNGGPLGRHTDVYWSCRCLDVYLGSTGFESYRATLPHRALLLYGTLYRTRPLCSKTCPSLSVRSEVHLWYIYIYIYIYIYRLL
jgi:hypothetical protein